MLNSPILYFLTKSLHSYKIGMWNITCLVGRESQCFAVGGAVVKCQQGTLTTIVLLISLHVA